jgi:hypothetical protein
VCWPETCKTKVNSDRCTAIEGMLGGPIVGDEVTQVFVRALQGVS